MADLALALQISIARRGFGAFAEAGGGLQGMATGLRAVSGELAALGIQAAVRGIQESIRTFVDFDTAIRRAAATLGREGIARFDELNERARALGASTQFSASQVADAFQFLAQAGLSVDDTLRAVQDVLNLATVGNLELGDAANFATNIMSGFGKEVGDLTGIINIMAATATGSNTDITDLAQAMSFAAPTANLLNLEVSEVSAAIGILGNNGIFATRAGTGLRRIMSILSDTTNVGTQALQAAGVAIDQFAAGNLSLEQILGQVQAALDAGTVTQQQLNDTMGIQGRDAFNILLASMQDAEGGLGALKADLEDSGTAAQDFVDFIAEGPGFAMAEFEAAIESLKIELGQVFIPVLTEFIEIFKENQGEIVKFITAIGKFTPILVELLPLLGELAQQVGDTIVFLEDIGAVEGFADVLTILGAEITNLLTQFPGLGKVLVALLIPIIALVAVVGQFSDEISIAIQVIAVVITGIINLISWVVFVGVEIAKLVQGIIEWTGLWDPLVAGVKIAVTWLERLWNWIVDIGNAISDSKVGEFFEKIFTTTAPLGDTFGFQMGNRVVRETGAAIVHPGEVITNPALGQDAPGSPEGGILIENFNLTVNEMPADAFAIEREIRKGIDLLRGR